MAATRQANYEAVERELKLHDPRLASLPRVLALSKADLVDPGAAATARANWQERLGPDVPVVVTSSATRAGIEELKLTLARLVPVQREPDQADEDQPVLEELAEHRVFRPAADRAYQIERLPDGSFRVSGRGVERLVARYDLDNEDALAHLERRLRGVGVIDALASAGFEPGDDVEIAGVTFQLDPDV